MADENVDIKIRFDAKTADLNRAIAKLAVLEKQVKKLSSGREEAFARRTTNTLSNVTKGWKRSFDFIDAGAKMAGKGLTKFLGLAIKGVVIEMALLSATMIGVHALFAAGQFIMKTYRGAMQMVASGAAGVTVAIAAMSAAIREQQAAIFAYRGKGAPAFGSAMNQTRMGMRNLQSDASLATLGVDALNKAYGNMSKSMNTAQINKSGGAIKALMDFGSAGQDPAKGLEQVSIVIAALSDKKKGISDVITEAKKLGPEMEQALKKANVKTKKQFQELLMSGELAKSGGVTGQFDAVNGTLISQLKGYFTRLRGEFADFGDQFLEPLKVAFDRVFGTIRRDLQRVMGAIMFSFGTEGVVDNFASAIEKASNWLVKMIREYLPGAIGMFDRIGDWFTRFKRGWNLVLDQTRPLIDGARVLYKAFEPVWDALKRGADNLTLFRELLIQNQDNVQEFGERIGKLIDSLSKFFMNMKKMFMDMLPFLNDLVSGLTTVFDMISKIFTSGAGKGLAGALAPLMGFSILGRALSGVKGRLMPNVGAMSTQQMTVTANNVSIANPVGGMDGMRTMLGGGPLSSGAPGGSAAGAAGTAGAAGVGAIDALSSGKTSGGNFQKMPAKEGVGKLADNPRNSLRYDMLMGSRMTVRGSDINQREKERFTQRQQLGRGLGYYLFGQSSNPYAKMEGDAAARASARFEATQGLQSLSMDELHKTAVDKHGITGLTDKTSRTDIIARIQGSAGYKDEDYAGMRKVGLGEAIKNTRGRMRFAATGAMDRAQYAGRRVSGAYQGAMAYFNSGAFNPETGEYYDVGGARDKIDERFQKTREEAGGSKRKLLRARIDRARDTNRINRQYGKFGNAYNMKFAKSASGRMGAGMGLGLMSQVAPEEMRGAMALGATVGQIDPRLGIAVAGIGGAMKAQGAMKGALSGAAGGAALGGMLGPQGAAIGAGIGLVVGGIMGAVNKGKQQLKEARETVHKSLGEFYMASLKSSGEQFEKNRKILESGGSLEGKSGAMQGAGAKFAAAQGKVRTSILSAIEAGGGGYGSGGDREFYDPKKILDEYYKTEEGSKVSTEDRKKQKKRATNTVRELLKATDPAVQTQLKEIDKVNNDRIAALSRATGKSGAELEQLAKSMGVDLYDATVQYDELLGKFTANLRKNKEQLNAALTDVFLSGANPFTKKREAGEAQYALNQNFRQIGDILRGGGSKAEKMGAVDSGMEQAFSQILTVAGGDAFKAYDMYNRMFMSGADQGIFAKGAEFEGQSEYFLGNETFNESSRLITEGVNSEAATQIRGYLAEKNMSVDTGLLEASLNKMTPDQQRSLLYDLQTMDDDTSIPKAGETNDLKKALKKKTGGGIEQALATAYGLEGIAITGEKTESLDKIATAATDFSTAADGLKTAVETFNTNMTGFFDAPLGNAPEWWKKGLKVTGEGDDMRLMPDADTSTPRAGQVGDTATSKLSQTMSRHAAMNGQLTGKRTVTSSLRNYALGSPSSDHATGSAYDLTGQNLGQYAKLVHANGGFAEFHGSMASRHLHVVPGPGVGDTTSVRPVSSVSTGGGGTTNYYSIEINGANASPEAIANMVMAKLKDQERSNRERR
jgi:hypothetical protein